MAQKYKNQEIAELLNYPLCALLLEKGNAEQGQNNAKSGIRRRQRFRRAKHLRRGDFG